MYNYLSYYISIIIKFRIIENFIWLDSGGKFVWYRKVRIIEYVFIDIFFLILGLFGNKIMVYKILLGKDGFNY